jgi:hypothetical protein
MSHVRPPFKLGYLIALMSFIENGDLERHSSLMKKEDKNAEIVCLNASSLLWRTSAHIWSAAE